MKTIKVSEKTIGEAIEVLKSGGLVIFPSDTVYGLLVDATNDKAVEKLTTFKSRPAGKPISVFVNEKLLEEVIEIGEKQRQILESLLPGPFTVILKSKRYTSNLLESEKGTLGIRIPDYKLINDLVEKFGKPITATSANISGRAPYHSVESLLKQLSENKRQLIDLVVDAGKLPRNKPSTIVDLTTPQIRILRRGDIVFKEVQTLRSDSPVQTQRIARNLLRNQQVTNKPLIFIIEGDLGVGKTIFVKGLGKSLGAKDIISPTFVVYYEYPIKTGKLVHIDLYNLTEDEEFKHLGLEQYLKPGNILAFEWGEKAGKIFKTLKQKGNVIHIEMKYLSNKQREIKVKS